MTRWLVCIGFAVVAPAFASTGVAAAASPSTTAAAASQHITPFAPLTTQGRAKTGRHTIKRGGKAPVALIGRTSEAGAVMSGPKSVPSSSTPRRNAPLSSPPPPELPDELASFPGTSQASAIHTFGPDQEVTPPNEDIAVGTTDVVEVVNSTVYVFSRSGAVLGSDDLNAFMDVDPGYHSSDPRVMYDGNPYDGGPPRFWITVSEVPNSFSGCPRAAGVLIAVSPSSSPLPFADWLVYELPIGLDTPGTSFGDQPGLSVGTDIVTVTFDDFDCNLNFLGSEIDIIQKTDLIQDEGITPLVFFYGGPFAPQPVQPSDEVETVAGSTYVVTNESDCGSVACADPEVEFDVITGDPEANNVQLQQGFEPMSPTSVDNSTGFLPPAQQKGTSLMLQTNDDRFLNAVLSVNGSIWTAAGTSCIPPGDTVERACLDFINLDNGASQIDNVGIAGASLFYPAVGVDANGDMFAVFDESSSTMFPTILDATVTDIGYPPVLSSFQTLHTSSTYYDGDDLFANACDGEGCRWGDYSGVAQDPLNTNDVWVVSGAADGVVEGACTTIHACWNTDISELTVSAPIINAVSPAIGPVVGGQKVTVTGFDFATETTVTLGGSPIAISNLTPTSFTFITPPAAASGGSVQIQATNAFGSSSEGMFTSYLYEPLANFVPVTPFRIYDSRKDIYGPLGPGETRLLILTDLSSIPPNATAVVLNVTAINGSAASFITLWPDYPEGTPRPNASNLNFSAHTVVANLVTVDLGFDGAVNIFNDVGAVDVAVDVEGWFVPQPSTDLAGLFHPVSPVRVCDTRPGSPTPACAGRTVAAGVPLVVNVTGGSSGIPSDGTAAAAVLNVTGVNGSAGTFISVFPTSSNGTCAYSGSNQPKVSTLNLVAGAVQANRLMVELGPAHTGGTDTSVCVYSALGKINVLLDVSGWFGSASATASTHGYQYQAIGPIRICDTRVTSLACPPGTIAGGLSRLLTVAGAGGVPAVGASTVVVAIIANLTAIEPTKNTYLTLFPASLPSKPLVSDINVNAGAVLPNLAVVELGVTGNARAGEVNLYNSVGSVNAIVDLEGWFQ
jgi:hypothetical protein